MLRRVNWPRLLGRDGVFRELPLFSLLMLV